MIRTVATLILALWAASVQTVQAQPSVATTQGGWRAKFDQPTDRYGHGIMGDVPEWGRMCLSGPAGQGACVTLPEARVFEDMSPRLTDVDQDGTPDVILIESDQNLGASLVIYFLRDGQMFRVATPPIGQAFRWLAPIGVADMDGDGAMELAYIDRPHLAKILRVWRFENDRLREVASLPNLSNHRIGQDFISGGLRDCGQGVEIITSDSNWQNIMATRLSRGKLTTKPIAPFEKTEDFAPILACIN